MKDHQIAETVNNLTQVARRYAGTQQLREHIRKEVLACLADQPAQPAYTKETPKITGWYWRKNHYGTTVVRVESRGDGKFYVYEEEWAGMAGMLYRNVLVDGMGATWAGPLVDPEGRV